MNGHFPWAASQHLKSEHTCTSPEIVLKSIYIFCSWWVGQVESNFPFIMIIIVKNIYQFIKKNFEKTIENNILCKAFDNLTNNHLGFGI